MAANRFGTQFAITTFGESHGPGVGCVIDGCPPGLVVDLDAVQAELTRRRPGQSKLVTPRKEDDAFEVLSGLDQETGATLGTPIALLVRNQDQRSSSYADWHHIYRPSHADFTYDAKYGIRAWQGGGRSSARETIGRVAAGAIARQLLTARFADLRITAWVEQVAAITCPDDIDGTAITAEQVDAHPTRCPDPTAAAEMETAILAAKRSGDSLGGVVRCVVQGLPPGLGDPMFAKLDAILAQAMLSLPACKGFEIGSGFAGPAGHTGLSHNDPFAWDGDTMTTASNRSGGVQGGITNGMPVDFRAVFKPTATVLQPQDSADDTGANTTLQAKGRHDPCVLPRAVPIVEAMVCLTLVDAWLCQRAQVGDPWPGLDGPLKKADDA